MDSTANLGGRPVVGRVIEVRFGNELVTAMDAVADHVSGSRSRFIREAVEVAVQATTVDGDMLAEWGLSRSQSVPTDYGRDYLLTYGEGVRVIFGPSIDPEGIAEEDAYNGWTVEWQDAVELAPGEFVWETGRTDHYMSAHKMLTAIKTETTR